MGTRKNKKKSFIDKAEEKLKEDLNKMFISHEEFEMQQKLREVKEQAALPFIFNWSDIMGKEAWEQYLVDLHRRSTTDEEE